MSRIPFEINGRTFFAPEGDTLLVAMLSQAKPDSEFGDGERAGFCMTGACQDCWLWTAAGERVRACSTQLTAGMRFVTEDPCRRDPRRHNIT